MAQKKKSLSFRQEVVQHPRPDDDEDGEDGDVFLHTTALLFLQLDAD